MTLRADKTLDEKWNEIRFFYQRYYPKIHFRHRLEDAQIEMLYKRMWQVSDEINEWLDSPKKPPKKYY